MTTFLEMEIQADRAIKITKLDDLETIFVDAPELIELARRELIQNRFFSFRELTTEDKYLTAIILLD